MTMVTILLMAAITFGVRYLFFIQALPFELNGKAKEFLDFTGPCVLAAMVAPIMFGSVNDGSLFYSPYLLGGIITIVISLMVRNTLMIVFLGMTIFSLLKCYL